MAALRSKKANMQYGSASWVSTERDSARQFVQDEVEEFEYSVINEMEWLNEHMADIFGKTRKCLTDFFKTPGKLRGKTPRTTRKRNAPEARAPLTDIFAPNQQASSSSPRAVNPDKKKAFRVIIEEIARRTTRDSFEKEDKLIRTGKENTDSGYHGSEGTDPQQAAKGPLTSSFGVDEPMVGSDAPHAANDQAAGIPEAQYESVKDDGTKQHHPAPSPSPAHDVGSVEDVPMSENHSQLEHTRSPLDDGSSPVQPVLRKSSVSFAALPAREPLATKASIGARVSRTSHIEGSILHGAGHTNILGHQAGSIGVGSSQAPWTGIVQEDDHLGLSIEKPALSSKDSDNDMTLTQLHRKTSTQRLHERISQLGQSQPARPSKSIPSILQQVSLSDLPVSPKPALSSEVPKPISQPDINQALYDDEEDWIPPPRPATYSANPCPFLEKRYPADVMEDNMGKDNAGKPGHEVPAQISQPEKQPYTEVDYPQLQTEKQTELMHEESASVSTVESHPVAGAAPPVAPAPHAMVSAHDIDVDASQKPMTRANPKLGKHLDDEPLSASKAKLSSIFKSARGIFASSAGISAQAKMESLSLSTMKMGTHVQATATDTVAAPSLEVEAIETAASIGSAEPKVTSPSRAQTVEQPTRKTRGSTEAAKKKAKEEEERQNLANELEWSEKSEQQPPATAEPAVNRDAEPDVLGKRGDEPDEPGLIENPRRQSQRKRKPSNEDINTDAEVEHPVKVILAEKSGGTGPGSESSHAQSQPATRSMKDIKRPTKPGKAPASKAKPVPVAIKVGMTSQRELDHRKVKPANPPNTTLSSNLQQSLAPTAASTKQTRPVATNLRKVTTNTTLKSSVSSQPPRPRALAAAARKKEQDEREAQRKLEAKREMERKKLQQEEERKKEQQRREMESQRQREQAATQAEDSKKAAQKQAIERRRLENARKQEQQKNGPMQTRARNGNNLASAIQQEKTQTQTGALPSRGELSNARPVSKMHTATNIAGPSEESIRFQPQINPARPPKRVVPAETTDERPFGPPSKTTSTYIQADSKRRKTNGEDDILIESRQPMPPPLRQSTLRKDTQQNRSTAATPGFNINTPVHYESIPPTSFRPTSLAQHNLQANKAGTGYSHPHHPDMAKFANTKIPFADNPGNNAGPSSVQKGGPNHASLDNKYKLSSPAHINPSDIELPEIPTDSEEDEDDEDDYYADMRKQLNLNGANKKKKKTPFKVPEWAESPALRETLMAQQLMDPQKVFGPIPPLNLEEVFKNANPKQLARFRNRTSSANWSGPDRLTEEEIRKDMEARRKLMEQGEWTYGLM